MYNGRIHIYFIQHKNDTIYTTWNTQRDLFIVFPENSKIRPGYMPPCWPKPRLCHWCWQASSMCGDLKFSHALLHMTARGLRPTVKYCVNSICNTFSKYASRKTSWKFRKKKNPMSAVLCKTIYWRMANFLITGAVTRESCRAEGTGQLDLFTKKDYHNFLGLTYHLRKAEQSMDKRNHLHQYNSKSQATALHSHCNTTRTVASAHHL